MILLKLVYLLELQFKNISFVYKANLENFSRLKVSPYRSLSPKGLSFTSVKPSGLGDAART